MTFPIFVRASLTLTFGVSLLSATGAQTNASAKQRLQAVDDHLTRYVILKNSDHA
jgi:hypothetical protein